MNGTGRVAQSASVRGKLLQSNGAISAFLCQHSRLEICSLEFVGGSIIGH